MVMTDKSWIELCAKPRLSLTLFQMLHSPQVGEFPQSPHLEYLSTQEPREQRDREEPKKHGNGTNVQENVKDLIICGVSSGFSPSSEASCGHRRVPPR